MPRQPRLDAPGLLQHVMARGIERREIFKDDKDRTFFLERLGTILEEAQTQCYAWALIPNHFHLLLRTGSTPLSKVMGRLMTGYAVTFNKRHRRSGHLFQNRYKSVVCEEDPYLLELIRYIHLNPLRAGLLKDLTGLDRYPWSGHAAILGRRKNPLIPEEASGRDKPSKLKEHKLSLAEKTIEDFLLYFGDTKKAARRRYHEFVRKGIGEGTRRDLQGGGLIRSAGGDKKYLLGRKVEEREEGDERILGSGDFVNEALRRAGDDREKRQGIKISLSKLIEKVASRLDLKVGAIISSSRRRKISDARAIISRLAVADMGYSASEVGRSLGLSRVNVGRCADRGKEVLGNYLDLKDIAK